MKLALALIVKNAPQEREPLLRCLSSIAQHVDGIFITLTNKKGEKKDTSIATMLQERFDATISWFEWVNDFSKARNFNFSQVPKEYTHIMWCDADDFIKGGKNLKGIIQRNTHIDGFGMWYLYDWDEFNNPIVAHKKTMIVKNDGTFTWNGAIHEDLTCERQTNISLIDEKIASRLHLSSPTRIEDSAQRNLEIAKAQLKDDSADPRTHWNTGNAYFGVKDYANAIESYKTFLSTTESKDEKYIVYQRIADAYKQTGKMAKCFEYLQSAIGLKPELPEAYYLLSHAYYDSNDFDEAKKYCFMGFLKPPQIHNMIVFNPRDYDYNPMMLMAKIFYRKNQPDLMLAMLRGCLKICPKDKKLQQMVREGEIEAKLMERADKVVEKLRRMKNKDNIKKELDALPVDMRSHPKISVIRNALFVKEKSSGKDMVIYCGATNHQWSPLTFKTKGIGGSEEAVIHMAREFSKQGWNVTVYNACGHKEIKADGVTYRPFWEWNYRDKQDVLILWRWAMPLDAEINCDKIFIDLHDVVPSAEFTPARLKKLTKVFVKTNAHRILFPNIPDDKIEVIPNGFDLPPSGVKKDPYLIINTSSPDRSMVAMPELFKRIKKRVPKARMEWAYGWDIWDMYHATNEKSLTWKNNLVKAMTDAGIKQLGKLPQDEVAQLYHRGSVFLYPTEFYEIDCISVKKAQAGYCFPVTTDFSALKESNKFGVKIHSSKTKDNWSGSYQNEFSVHDEDMLQQFEDAVVSQLLKPTKLKEEAIESWRKHYDWKLIAKKWNDIITL